MTGYALIAVGPVETLPAPDACVRAQAKGLAALLWRPGPSQQSFWSLLDAAHAAGPALPAAPGTVIRDEGEAQAMLTANAASLEAALDAWGSARQFTATIDGGGAEAVAEAALAQIACVALDVVRVVGPSGATDLTIAAPADAGPGLRAALAAASAGARGVSARLIGPSPLFAFAALHLERPRAEDVRAARHRLGLVEGASLEDIRAAKARLHEEQEAQAAGDLLVRIAAAKAACAGPAPLVFIRGAEREAA